jgi:conjugative transfer pilus assembly protein TraH
VGDHEWSVCVLVLHCILCCVGKLEESLYRRMTRKDSVTEPERAEVPMIKALITAGVVFLAGLVALPAQADVNGDLNGFFGSLGYSGNVSQAQAWQGQAAGYFSGGSVYLRNPVKNVQLISMQLPSLNAGCGGIDAYLGSFSMISGEEIQRFVKQIMSNAAGYAFDLALQTMVPELKQAKDFLQKLANDVNSMNMSSCQAAQGIIGGLWPVTQVSQQKICQDIRAKPICLPTGRRPVRAAPSEGRVTR